MYSPQNLVNALVSPFPLGGGQQGLRDTCEGWKENVKVINVHTKSVDIRQCDGGRGGGLQTRKLRDAAEGALKGYLKRLLPEEMVTRRGE